MSREIGNLLTKKLENTSAYFSCVNWGKEHLFLDYSNNEDFSKLLSLLKEADVIICNFKYGDAEKFNLTYLDVQKINNKVIYAQLNGFKSQPKRVAFDVVLQAECGYMHMNGQKGLASNQNAFSYNGSFGCASAERGDFSGSTQKRKDRKRKPS